MKRDVLSGIMLLLVAKQAPSTFGTHSLLIGSDHINGMDHTRDPEK
jgi:hypothetical protein